ncbi:MAG: thiolase family protein [Pseudomonadota bacterium]|nr:thiolase family protein [Pseudomonadota bacterium]
MSVYLVGVGMTKFGRLPDSSVKDITTAAVSAALADAGIGTEAIEAAYFANATQGALEGQYMIPGQVALREMGIEGVPVVNVENACASASTAFALACKDIRAGDASVVLAVGAEKMLTEDKQKNMAVFDGAIDVNGRDATLERLLALSDGFETPPEALVQNGPRSIFMDVYAAIAKHHMKLHGTTQRQMAAVAAKNHRHSVYNELSQFRNSFTIEEVLAARGISWPLTLPMCSPISDGGAAAILCSSDALDRFDSSRAIKVAASVIATGSERDPDNGERHVTRLASQKAYERAGVGPDDMSFAEVHDASAIAEILQTENLGFCPIGEGGPLAESGATEVGGRIPVNPSGGLESKGHPIGATGLGQIHELAVQLRGEAKERQVENARFGIAENGGGMHGIEEAVACVTILERSH